MPIVQINLSILHENFIKANEQIKVYPIVKCNAYGLGLNKVINTLQGKLEGCFVLSVEEANSVENNDIDIYVLDSYKSEQSKKNNIFPVISTEEEVIYWSHIQPRKCILQVECGFNRQGLRKVPANNLNVQYVIGHMSGNMNNFDIAQYNMFEKRTLGLNYKKSIICSPYLNQNIVKYDMARLGKYIYGGQGAKNIIRMKAKIIHIKKVYEGETIGYNKSYIVKNDMNIAMLELGYAYGFPAFINNGIVSYKGKKLSILDSRSMNYTFIEAHNEMQIGEYVNVIDDDMTLENLAFRSNMLFSQLLLNLCNNRLNDIEYVERFCENDEYHGQSME